MRKRTTLQLLGRQFVVALTVHGPGDAQCCPTQGTERRYGVQAGRLVPVGGR